MTQLGKDTSVLGLAADHRAVAKLLSPSVQGSPGGLQISFSASQSAQSGCRNCRMVNNISGQVEL